MGRSRGWLGCLEFNSFKESRLIGAGLSSEHRILIAALMLPSSNLEDTAAAIIS
jgi:hypothetical protein